MTLCIINGKQQTTAAHTTVAQLLGDLRLAGHKIAVEKNGKIVPKSRHHSETIADGDVLEIVRAVGGG